MASLVSSPAHAAQRRRHPELLRRAPHLNNAVGPRPHRAFHEVVLLAEPPAMPATTVDSPRTERSVFDTAPTARPAQSRTGDLILNDSLQTPLPPPGLDGTYSQSCLLCLHGTDTGLAFGPAEAEWALACLAAIGLPDDQAHRIVSAVTGSADGTVPATEVTIGVRVCRNCFSPTDLAKTGCTVGMFPDVPAYRPPY